MFNTLLYTKRLEASGMNREQAESQVQVMTEMIVDGVSTKQDLNLVQAKLQADIDRIKANIDAFRAEFKADIDALRAEVKADIAEVKAYVGTCILASENRMLVRMGTMFLASTTITVSLLAWILK